jgi:hypothetical protein
MSEEYTPRTARERVIVYQLLDDLKTHIDRNHAHLFGILPITDFITKDDIRIWINHQHELLAKDGD